MGHTVNLTPEEIAALPIEKLFGFVQNVLMSHRSEGIDAWDWYLGNWEKRKKEC